nr:2Fe-2S iron-sulfur cluster-binding protein [Tissierella sp.]
MIINMSVNGVKQSFMAEADEFLLEVLRRNGYMSIKKGCDTGSCGVCSVLIDGKPTLSCAFFAVRAENKEITTIEGISKEEKKIGEFLVEEGVDQCGYCSPGLILTVSAMKKELNNPTEEEVKSYLTGNLCRCTGYVGQLRAIMRYMEVS